MRDHLKLLINGREQHVGAEHAFTTLADFLRQQRGETGTKIVCAEGDCGACTVLVRRPGDPSFRAVNSCIQAMLQLDGTSVVTVEGLAGNGNGHGLTVGKAVQDAMVACHGAQCGYCTPGFVVAMSGMFEHRDSVTVTEAREELVGNLCRCTGYEPIIRAACSVDGAKAARMRETYSDGIRDDRTVRIETDGRIALLPVTIEEAVSFRATTPGCTIVQGGTDVGVWVNKRNWTSPALLSLTRIASLRELSERDGEVIAGANVTLTDFEAFIRDRIPELYAILRLFGSPQIRNAGTLVGNIANGSPIGDTLPYLFVSGAILELASPRGTREVAAGAFYKGYRQFELAADEIIVRVRVPIVRNEGDEVLRLYKVSRRRDLDISAFTAAIRLTVQKERISAATIAYGGVGPVVLRLPKTEAFLAGRDISLETFAAAGRIARGEITPISDVRGSKDYRLQLAENILCRFFYDISGATGFGPSQSSKRSETAAGDPR